MLPLSLLTTLALAVSPSSETFEGIEPQRLLVTHPAEQARLLASSEWRAFADRDGAGWTATFDETTGLPRWMWGRGIPVPTSSVDALSSALTSLFDRHANLLGTRPGVLAMRSANHDEGSDTWYVEFDVLREGLPTYRGGISARVKHGNLVAVKAATAPAATVEGVVVLSAAEAVARATMEGPAPEAVHTEVAVRPMLLERRSLEGFSLRRTFQVRSSTQAPAGRWVAFVDAETGEVLDVYNELRFVSGTVTARHHERTVDGSNLITSPLPLAVVRSSSDSDVTDSNGDYTVSGAAPYDTDFDGDYLRVYNAAGSEGTLSDSSTSLEWTSSDATQAEIDTFKFVHDAKAWGDVYAPTVPWVRDPVVATVNLGQTCNAYWDGTLNFFSSGGGCNNTGQIADVVYHEWGHGFHYGSLQGGSFDGSLSEGAGDVVAVILTQDSNMSPYFNQGLQTGIRNLSPDRVYPRDIVREVHEDGLIFGGAIWDLMGLLQDDLGEAGGTAATSEIFAGLLRGGPDIPDSFNEALVADDDDGNLGNGTPHICQITEAFGRHGLGTATGPSVVIASHDQVIRADAETRIPVAVELVSVAAGCEAVQADEGTVHWRVGKGAWQTEPMSTSGGSAEGDIPPQPAGTILEYYLTGDAGGDPFESPSGGPVRPYTTYVGDLLEVHCDDFEANDGGFSHELVSGTAADGADDWQWGTPNGRSGDPSGAFSGNKVWGNDLGHDEFDGAYQADKHNRITSGEVDTAWYTGVFLNYRRWLQVEDREYDHAVISIDGEVLWENYTGSGEDHHADAEWMSHVVDLQGKADQRRVRVSFDLQTDGGLQMGGWTMDDVCFVAPATTDNKMGIGDFRVEAIADTAARLTWTQPRHGPVEKVRVVRRIDRQPTGADDGAVAYESDSIAPGAPMELEDPNYHSGTTYYAVYGYDGSGWLSWTRSGWNAGEVDLVGGEPPEGVLTEDGMVVSEGLQEYRSMGCGCSSTSAVGGLAGLLPLLLLGRRRR